MSFHSFRHDGRFGHMKKPAPTPAHDVKTKSGLTNVFNQKVVHSTEVRRPMGSIPASIVEHRGMKVTTDKGNQFLIHKGPNYGKTGDNVVLNAKHMKTSTWHEVKGTSRPVTNGATVSHVVNSAQGQYSVLNNNCIGASNKMDKAMKK